MNFLKALFGPRRRDVWRQLAGEVDGQFHEGGLFNPFAVQARTGDWILTLDTFTSGDGKTNQTFTRLRAPYFNPDGFRFEIYRAGLLSGLGKAMGLQDIEVGHPRFDRDFVIKGNAPRRLRRLFDNRKIRAGIQVQPKIHLSVKGHAGWFSRFPDGVDELHFRAERAIKDLAQLRALFDLFGEILRHVCHNGKAQPDDVPVHIRRLGSPGGQIMDKYVLWEGDRPRRDAAAKLGRLGDPAAIPALADVLWDDDAVLRLRAVEALAAIRHPDAIGPLVPLLGDARKAAGLRFRDGVAEALRQLGEAELVVTVGAALGGDFGRLKAYDGGHRAGIVAALGHALGGSSGAHAANALAEIHAVEALPRLREVHRSAGTRDDLGQAISAAIGKLEARAALPRAASAADVEVETLPRSAQAPAPDPGTLPRSSPAP
ncbi:MAG: HEAT repeat domain-containing protein [Gemmatimonadota bacterium]|uniref:HEAT repeat domain-containing protein n=1 Tax=Candidatus Palauibacter scopulicola TaxID=3056741 RepID=UPI0023A58807|nr:HEAT repeat domain-containing protein [Candidatus Palauibacter scopulicola]MDE2662500.1 HEAT repeat domain-containing protein [Candidatus Palauibacter scopulicola]